jgi:hypothetical protein
MDKHEEDFEQFLRQFRPRQPRILPEALLDPPQRRSLSAWLLAAAMLGICVVGSFLLWRVTPGNVDDGSLEPDARQTSVAEAMTVGRLMRLATLDPRRLDATLTEASPRLLPDVERNGSTLRVLAKE